MGYRSYISTIGTFVNNGFVFRQFSKIFIYNILYYNIFECRDLYIISDLEQ